VIGLGAVSIRGVLAGFSRVSEGSVMPGKRVVRGLRLLRMWMRRHPDFFYLRPGAIARELGLGRGAAVDIGYALRYWEKIGLAARDRESRARYIPLHRLIYKIETYGCLGYDECPSEAPCGLTGTQECPFLVGVLSND